MIKIRSREARVSLSPELGASLTQYTLEDGREILRPSTVPADGFGCACYLLAPWCNRIAGGITLPETGFHAIAPTHPAHPLPIHGSAALVPWDVVEASAEHVTLQTEADWPAPFHYRAEVTWALQGATLAVDLSVEHLGLDALPYGLGIHPWFRRTKATRLQAKATHCQRTNASMLPEADVPITERPEWDFSAMQRLPEGLIDTAFGGWDGQARIEISNDLAVQIGTEPRQRIYQLYSSGADADFVCFEPVSHPVNSHNSDGHPGLVWLGRGASTSLRIVFAPEPIPG